MISIDNAMEPTIKSNKWFPSSVKYIRNQSLTLENFQNECRRFVICNRRPERAHNLVRNLNQRLLNIEQEIQEGLWQPTQAVKDAALDQIHQLLADINEQFEKELLETDRLHAELMTDALATAVQLELRFNSVRDKMTEVAKRALVYLHIMLAGRPRHMMTTLLKIKLPPKSDREGHIIYHIFKKILWNIKAYDYEAELFTVAALAYKRWLNLTKVLINLNIREESKKHWREVCDEIYNRAFTQLPFLSNNIADLRYQRCFSPKLNFPVKDVRKVIMKASYPVSQVYELIMKINFKENRFINSKLKQNTISTTQDVHAKVSRPVSVATEVIFVSDDEDVVIIDDVPETLDLTRHSDSEINDKLSALPPVTVNSCKSSSSGSKFTQEQTCSVDSAARLSNISNVSIENQTVVKTLKSSEEDCGKERRLSLKETTIHDNEEELINDNLVNIKDQNVDVAVLDNSLEQNANCNKEEAINITTEIFEHKRTEKHLLNISLEEKSFKCEKILINADILKDEKQKIVSDKSRCVTTEIFEHERTEEQFLNISLEETNCNSEKIHSKKENIDVLREVEEKIVSDKSISNTTEVFEHKKTEEQLLNISLEETNCNSEKILSNTENIDVHRQEKEEEEKIVSDQSISDTTEVFEHKRTEEQLLNISLQETNCNSEKILSNTEIIDVCRQEKQEEENIVSDKLRSDTTEIFEHKRTEQFLNILLEEKSSNSEKIHSDITEKVHVLREEEGKSITERTISVEKEDLNHQNIQERLLSISSNIDEDKESCSTKKLKDLNHRREQRLFNVEKRNETSLFNSSKENKEDYNERLSHDSLQERLQKNTEDESKNCNYKINSYNEETNLRLSESLTVYKKINISKDSSEELGDHNNERLLKDSESTDRLFAGLEKTVCNNSIETSIENVTSQNFSSNLSENIHNEFSKNCQFHTTDRDLIFKYMDSISEELQTNVRVLKNSNLCQTANNINNTNIKVDSKHQIDNLIVEESSIIIAEELTKNDTDDVSNETDYDYDPSILQVEWQNTERSDTIGECDVELFLQKNNLQVEFLSKISSIALQQPNNIENEENNLTIDNVKELHKSVTAIELNEIKCNTSTSQNECSNEYECNSTNNSDMSYVVSEQMNINVDSNSDINVESNSDIFTSKKINEDGSFQEYFLKNRVSSEEKYKNDENVVTEITDSNNVYSEIVSTFQETQENSVTRKSETLLPDIEEEVITIEVPEENNEVEITTHFECPEDDDVSSNENTNDFVRIVEESNVESTSEKCIENCNRMEELIETMKNISIKDVNNDLIHSGCTVENLNENNVNVNVIDIEQREESNNVLNINKNERNTDDLNIETKDENSWKDNAPEIIQETGRNKTTIEVTDISEEVEEKSVDKNICRFLTNTIITEKEEVSDGNEKNKIIEERLNSKEIFKSTDDCEIKENVITEGLDEYIINENLMDESIEDKGGGRTMIDLIETNTVEICSNKNIEVENTEVIIVTENIEINNEVKSIENERSFGNFKKESDFTLNNISEKQNNISESINANILTVNLTKSSPSNHTEYSESNSKVSMHSQINCDSSPTESGYLSDTDCPRIISDTERYEDEFKETDKSYSGCISETSNDFSVNKICGNTVTKNDFMFVLEEKTLNISDKNKNVICKGNNYYLKQENLDKECKEKFSDVNTILTYDTPIDLHCSTVEETVTTDNPIVHDNDNVYENNIFSDENSVSSTEKVKNDENVHIVNDEDNITKLSEDNNKDELQDDNMKSKVMHLLEGDRINSSNKKKDKLYSNENLSPTTDKKIIPNVKPENSLKIIPELKSENSLDILASCAIKCIEKNQDSFSCESFNETHVCIQENQTEIGDLLNSTEKIIDSKEKSYQETKNDLTINCYNAKNSLKTLASKKYYGDNKYSTNENDTDKKLNQNQSNLEDNLMNNDYVINLTPPYSHTDVMQKPVQNSLLAMMPILGVQTPPDVSEDNYINEKETIIIATDKYELVSDPEDSEINIDQNKIKRKITSENVIDLNTDKKNNCLSEVTIKSEEIRNKKHKNHDRGDKYERISRKNEIKVTRPNVILSKMDVSKKENNQEIKNKHTTKISHINNKKPHKENNIHQIKENKYSSDNKLQYSETISENLKSAILHTTKSCKHFDKLENKNMFDAKSVACVEKAKTLNNMNSKLTSEKVSKYQDTEKKIQKSEELVIDTKLNSKLIKDKSENCYLEKKKDNVKVFKTTEIPKIEPVEIINVEKYSQSKEKHVKTHLQHFENNKEKSDVVQDNLKELRKSKNQVKYKNIVEKDPLSLSSEESEKYDECKNVNENKCILTQNRDYSKYNARKINCKSTKNNKREDKKYSLNLSSNKECSVKLETINKSEKNQRFREPYFIDPSRLSSDDTGEFSDNDNIKRKKLPVIKIKVGKNTRRIISKFDRNSDDFHSDHEKKKIKYENVKKIRKKKKKRYHKDTELKKTESIIINHLEKLRRKDRTRKYNLLTSDEPEIQSFCLKNELISIKEDKINKKLKDNLLENSQTLSKLNKSDQQIIKSNSDSDIRQNTKKNMHLEKSVEILKTQITNPVESLKKHKSEETSTEIKFNSKNANEKYNSPEISQKSLFLYKDDQSLVEDRKTVTSKVVETKKDSDKQLVSENNEVSKNIIETKCEISINTKKQDEVLKNSSETYIDQCLEKVKKIKPMKLTSEVSNNKPEIFRKNKDSRQVELNNLKLNEDSNEISRKNKKYDVQDNVEKKEALKDNSESCKTIEKVQELLNDGNLMKNDNESICLKNENTGILKTEHNKRSHSKRRKETENIDKIDKELKKSNEFTEKLGLCAQFSEDVNSKISDTITPIQELKPCSYIKKTSDNLGSNLSSDFNTGNISDLLIDKKQSSVLEINNELDVKNKLISFKEDKIIIKLKENQLASQTFLKSNKNQQQIIKSIDIRKNSKKNEYLEESADKEILITDVKLSINHVESLMKDKDVEQCKEIKHCSKKAIEKYNSPEISQKYILCKEDQNILENSKTFTTNINYSKKHLENQFVSENNEISKNKIKTKCEIPSNTKKQDNILMNNPENYTEKCLEKVKKINPIKLTLEVDNDKQEISKKNMDLRQIELTNLKLNEESNESSCKNKKYDIQDNIERKEELKVKSKFYKNIETIQELLNDEHLLKNDDLISLKNENLEVLRAEHEKTTDLKKRKETEIIDNQLKKCKKSTDDSVAPIESKLKSFSSIKDNIEPNVINLNSDSNKVNSSDLPIDNKQSNITLEKNKEFGNEMKEELNKNNSLENIEENISLESRNIQQTYVCINLEVNRKRKSSISTENTNVKRIKHEHITKTEKTNKSTVNNIIINSNTSACLSMPILDDDFTIDSNTSQCSNASQNYENSNVTNNENIFETLSLKQSKKSKSKIPKTYEVRSKKEINKSNTDCNSGELIGKRRKSSFDSTNSKELTSNPDVEKLESVESINANVNQEEISIEIDSKNDSLENIPLELNSDIITKYIIKNESKNKYDPVWASTSSEIPNYDGEQNINIFEVNNASEANQLSEQNVEEHIGYEPYATNIDYELELNLDEIVEKKNVVNMPTDISFVLQEENETVLSMDMMEDIQSSVINYDVNPKTITFDEMLKTDEEFDTGFIAENINKTILNNHKQKFNSIRGFSSNNMIR